MRLGQAQLLARVAHGLADSLLLYREWLERVGSGSAEDRQILASLARFIERHGDSRFSDVHAAETDIRIRDRAGYWEDEPSRRLFLFNTSGLQEAAHGFGLARIVTALDTAGAIAKRDINPPVDRKWLSQYVGDIQRAWEIGDRETVGHMLFDGEFNDKIYRAP